MGHSILFLVRKLTSHNDAAESVHSNEFTSEADTADTHQNAPPPVYCKKCNKKIAHKSSDAVRTKRYDEQATKEDDAVANDDVDGAMGLLKEGGGDDKEKKDFATSILVGDMSSPSQELAEASKMNSLEHFSSTDNITASTLTTAKVGICLH